MNSFLFLTGLRLPTEAEWEFACRAGTDIPFYNGPTNDNLAGTLAWIDANSGNQTHAVGAKLPNGFGFYDMLGNVSEWVSDWFSVYTESPQIDPAGPSSGTYRIFRGGSFGDPLPYYYQAAFRLAVGGASWQSTAETAFRVARNP